MGQTNDGLDLLFTYLWSVSHFFPSMSGQLCVTPAIQNASHFICARDVANARCSRTTVNTITLYHGDIDTHEQSV